jgi:hypothetical protein
MVGPTIPLTQNKIRLHHLNEVDDILTISKPYGL